MGCSGGSGGYYSNSSYCSTGGKGGYSTGNLSVTSGSSVYVYVGGQGEGFATCNTKMQSLPQNSGGWNGGGNSLVALIRGLAVAEHRILDMALQLDRKIVAGGGGGGNSQNSTRLSNGGASGGTLVKQCQLLHILIRTPGSGATQNSGNSNGVGSSGIKIYLEAEVAGLWWWYRQ